MQARFAEQMEDWLDYACENREAHRTVQTARQSLSNGANVGNVKDGDHGKGRYGWFNTWSLYKAWRRDWLSRLNDGDPRRIFVAYNEAVPELHALLDWLSEPEREAAEVARKADRRRDVRNAHPLLDRITPKAED